MLVSSRLFVCAVCAVCADRRIVCAVCADVGICPRFRMILCGMGGWGFCYEFYFVLFLLSCLLSFCHDDLFFCLTHSVLV